MTTAWALLVVFSEAQSETLQHQRAWAERIAAEKGWRLARFFEGVASGIDGPRKLTRGVLLAVRATPPGKSTINREVGRNLHDRNE